MELKLALDRTDDPDATTQQVYATIAARLGAEGYAVCCIFWADCLAKGDDTAPTRRTPGTVGSAGEHATGRRSIADCGLRSADIGYRGSAD